MRAAWLFVLVITTAACAQDVSMLKPLISVVPDDRGPTAPDDRGLTVTMVLDPGDPQLSGHVTFRHATRALAHTPQGAYVATFALDTPVTMDEAVEVEVEGREMTVTAPPELTVVFPQSISRSEDTTLTWPITSPDAMGWFADGSCVNARGTIPANASSVTFTAADWMQTGDVTCTTELEIKRWRDAPLDPAFAGGRLTFLRFAEAHLESTP
jgi:hypothetical protein